LSDVDSDGDGVSDSQDAFPHDASESVDTDGDGTGNNADTDDDNDGALDVDEIAAGSDPLDPNNIASGGVVYYIITSPKTGHKWLDRNLGASQVCTSFNDATCYGDYYQWGRDIDGHEKSTSGTTSTQATSIISGHGNFIKGSLDWTSASLVEARAVNWSKRDGSSVCPVGFRVPTVTELKLETLDNGVTNRDTAFASFLKLPSAGYRRLTNGDMDAVGTDGYLWSSSVENTNSYFIGFRDSSAFYVPDGPAYAISVRCMKPVVTTDMPPVVTLQTDAQIEMIQFSTYILLLG